MATQRMNAEDTDARPSAEDLTGKEMRFATRNSDGEFALCGAAGLIAGVIQEGKPVGQSTSIAWGSTLRVTAGAAVGAGVRVNSDSTGRAVPGTANSFGISVGAVTAAGEVVEVQYMPSRT